MGRRQVKKENIETAVLDLYSGVGGISLGAARAGFSIKAAIDSDSRTSIAYKINFPSIPHFQRDIATLTWSDLKEELDYKDGIIHGVLGGPPCQGFSRIGRRHPDDQRNKLFGHFFRIVQEIRPWFYVAENVLGILDEEYSEIRIQALNRVKDYKNLPPIVLKSSDFGVPTNRSRVFFIGYLTDHFTALCENDFTPPSDVEQVTVGEALKGLPTQIDATRNAETGEWRKLRHRYEGTFWDNVFSNIPKGVGDKKAIALLTNDKVSGCIGTNHKPEVVERFELIEQGKVDSISRATRLSSKGFCPTLRAGTGPEHGSFQALRPIHPRQHRVITPREAARLQGFPDWFQFDKTKWHSFKQIGNSVSPILAENIFMIIKSKINGGGT